MKLSGSVYKSFESLCLQGYILEQMELKIAITGSLFWREIQIKEKAATSGWKRYYNKKDNRQEEDKHIACDVDLTTNTNPWSPLWYRLYWRNISF